MIDDLKEGQQKSSLLRRTRLKVFLLGQNFNHHLSLSGPKYGLGVWISLVQ